jgi:hypothetical protein
MLSGTVTGGEGQPAAAAPAWQVAALQYCDTMNITDCYCVSSLYCDVQQSLAVGKLAVDSIDAAHRAIVSLLLAAVARLVLRPKLSSVGPELLCSLHQPCQLSVCQLLAAVRCCVKAGTSAACLNEKAVAEQLPTCRAPAWPMQSACVLCATACADAGGLPTSVVGLCD